MCRKLDELFFGLYGSEIEYDGVVCRISSPIAILVVDFNIVDDVFHALVFRTVGVDELYDFGDDLGICVFVR